MPNLIFVKSRGNIVSDQCESLAFSRFKGTVSRELRWVLLYINRKLFSRAIVGHQNYFNFIMDDNSP